MSGGGGNVKFKYKLQNILDIKFKIEEQEKVNFSIAMEKLRSAKVRLEIMTGRRIGYEQELTELLMHGSNVIAIRQAEDSLEIIKLNERTILLEVALEEKNVEKARHVLNEAIKERKTFEKLRENAFEEFKLEMEAAEKKEVDELISYRFGVKLNGSEDI